MARKKRAIDILIENNIFDNQKEAAAWIMSGEVYSGTQRVTAAGQLFPVETVLTAKGHDKRYVSKGGLKLEYAIREFGMNVAGCICIDAGASTGGFTDCLCSHGAALVYAVDVGFGQLTGSLRQDARVINLEKTNISDDSLCSLFPVPTMGTIDVSYLSLLKAIPAFAEIMHHEGDLVCLVKPLFETEDAESRRSGIIADDVYVPLLSRLIGAINRLPYAVCLQATNSPVTGNAGTREFFLHVRLGKNLPPAPDLSGDIEGSVHKATSLSIFCKD